MKSSLNLSLIFPLLILFLSPNKAQDQRPTYVYHICPNDAVFTPNSSYQTNTQNISNPSAFNSLVAESMRDVAAGTPDGRKIAVKEANFTAIQRLVQWGSNGGISTAVIIAIVAPICVSILLFCLGCIFIRRRAKKKYSTVPGDNSESLQVSLNTIQVATNNFSEDHKLGEGGFGKVYKGTLSNGQEIAVKKLSKGSSQGSGEFKNEVLLLAKLQHRNLVRLLGFCLEGEEKMLVYEYVPNKSLGFFLFDEEKRGELDWSRRYKIVGGIARGINLFLHLLIIHFITLVPKAETVPFTYHECVYKNGNYTNNSTYQQNLNTLLDSISTNTQINYGFYNFTIGENQNQIYAIALCRPDIVPETCRACIRNASDSLLTLCPNVKEVIGGQDDCMVRYSFRDIFSLEESATFFWAYSQNNATDPRGFNEAKVNLLNRLGDNAAKGNSTYKFAMGEIEAPGNQIIYGLVQCTPDLSDFECRTCLRAQKVFSECCFNRSGGRVVVPSCNFRYEVDRFYTLISTDFSDPVSGNKSAIVSGNKSARSRTIIIIVIVSVVIPAIIAIFICIVTRREKKKKFNYSIDEIEEVESLQFDLDSIRIATDDFSEARKLGQGGFGSVYKGTLPNGQEIAVKRLSRGAGQGEQEFKNEVLLVAKLQHRNLVKLLGFCFEAEERLLVYEFVSNSSLDNFIFDPIKRAGLDWETRFKIIVGISRGLVYLHEDSRLRIVHRDLKASNILLDGEMNPKISDFGMARLFRVDQTQDDTSRIAGTFGYMAPEYVGRGHFSVKSDVFSFGVLILEILSGQKNNNSYFGQYGEDLLTYAWRNYDEGKALNVMDSTMVDGVRSEVMRCIHLGLLCVQESEANRPTMTQVITMLSSTSITLQIPLRPAFYIHTQPLRSPSLSNSRTIESDESRGQHLSQSRNEVSITELEPR